LALLFPYKSPAASWLPSLVSLLISANVVLLVISLFPWQVQTNYGRTGSDGWNLLHTPTMPEEEQSEQLASYYIQEGLEAYKQRDFRSARAWMEKGIEKYPEQPLVLNALGFVQVGTGEFEQSRETFLALLEHQLKPELKYMVLNNIAYANLMVGDSQLLPEADAYSAEAYQNAPWMPAIAGTRGAVLVEMGRLNEGVSLLKRAMAEHTDAQGKAANACYLAIAESHRGNPEEARRYLETARALDPTCYLLPRATEQLALSRSVIF
jgi:tetratricopeptide (TPR) repeat protein